MSATTTQQRDIAKNISRTFIQAYNEDTPDVIGGVMTEDFVAHVIGAGDLHGAAEYEGRIEGTLDAFPDFEKEEDLLLVDGDYFTVVYRWTGTHEGEFAGVSPTGIAVESKSLALGRMEDEKLAEMWIYGDSADVMEQLGVDTGN